MLVVCFLCCVRHIDNGLNYCPLVLLCILLLSYLMICIWTTNYQEKLKLPLNRSASDFRCVMTLSGYSIHDLLDRLQFFNASIIWNEIVWSNIREFYTYWYYLLSLIGFILSSSMASLYWLLRLQLGKV